MNIKKLIKESHEDAVKRGEYDCPKCNGKGYIKVGIALINSELYEALKAHRNNKFADLKMYNALLETACNNLTKKKIFENKIKDTFEDKWTGAFIRIFDLYGYLSKDIDIDLIQSAFETVIKHRVKVCYTISEFILEWIHTYMGKFALAGKYKTIRANSSLLGCCLGSLYNFCKQYEIDIETHIKLKMEYNKEY